MFWYAKEINYLYKEIEDDIDRYLYRIVQHIFNIIGIYNKEIDIDIIIPNYYGSDLKLTKLYFVNFEVSFLAHTNLKKEYVEDFYGVPLIYKVELVYKLEKYLLEKYNMEYFVGINFISLYNVLVNICFNYAITLFSNLRSDKNNINKHIYIKYPNIQKCWITEHEQSYKYTWDQKKVLLKKIEKSDNNYKIYLSTEKDEEKIFEFKKNAIQDYKKLDGTIVELYLNIIEQIEEKVK